MEVISAYELQQQNMSQWDRQILDPCFHLNGECGTVLHDILNQMWYFQAHSSTNLIAAIADKDVGCSFM